MDDTPGKDFERLYEALDALFDKRPENQSDSDFLEQHQGMRDLLEPMLQAPPQIDEDDAQALGDFRLLREVGRGGMGIVYEAWQTSLNRRVALKVLPAHVTLRDESVARFHREAKTAAKLEHPGIVDIHAIGSESGTHYFAMEFLDGAPLDRALARVRRSATDGATLHGRLLGEAIAENLQRSSSETSEPETSISQVWTRGWVDSVVRLVLQVADALEHAHQAGVIHRDVKPSNIIVRSNGSAVLTDFGLARDMVLPSLTMTGGFVGTPNYVSPEQAAGQASIDQRSDVFSLGATLYELLTLELPFPGTTVPDVLEAIRCEDPIDPQRHNPRLAPDLAAIVLKSLDKDPDRRYQTARELAEDLQAFLDYRPVQARRTTFATRMRRHGRRLLRRHPALVTGASVGLVAAVAVVLLLEKSGRQAELEYTRLCADADAAMTGYRSRAESQVVEQTFSRFLMRQDVESVERRGNSPREIYGQAIEILPQRPEAWFGRALTPGAPAEERFADLLRARERGLALRTFHLARAYLLVAIGKIDEAQNEQELATSDTPGTAMDSYFEGMLQHALGNTGEANELLTRAIDNPTTEAGIRYRALRARAGLRRRSGDFEAALRDLHVLDDPGHDSPSVQIDIALCWKGVGNESAANRAFDEAIRRARARGTPSGWAAICTACRSADMSWFDRATEQALAAHGSSPEIVLLRASYLRDGGRVDESLALCQASLAAHPRHAGLLHARAMAYVKLEEYQKALDDLDLAIEIDPSFTGAHRNRGNVLSYLKRFPEALKAFDAAERLDPGNVFVMISRGAVLMNDLDRAEDALRQFECAIEFQPRQVHAHMNRCRVLWRMKRYDDALVALDEAEKLPADTVIGPLDFTLVRLGILVDMKRYEDICNVAAKALRDHPRHRDLLVRHYMASYALKRYEEALASNAKAIEVSEEGDCGLLLDRGKLCEALGKFDEAAAAYEKAAKLDPKNHDARFQLGVLLHNKLRRYRDALTAFDAALELDPNCAGTLLNKVVVLQSLGQFRQALKTIGKAIAADPKDPELHSQRGTLLAKHFGRMEQALRCYEQALALDRSRAKDWHNKAISLSVLASYASSVGQVRGAKFEDALAAIDEAIRLDGKMGHYHIVRGEVLAMMPGGHAEAVAAFQRAAALGAHPVRLHTDLAQSLHALHRYDEALASCDEVLKRDANHHELRALRARALLDLQRFESALDETERMLAQRKDDGEARDLRALTLAYLGRFDDIGESGEEPSEARVRTLSICGKFEAALELAERLRDPFLHVSCLRAAGRIDEAVEAARRAMQGKSDDKLRYAYLCAVAGEADKARAALAAYDLPYCPFDHYLRVRVHCVLGEKQGALASFRRAVDSGLRLPSAMTPDPDLALIADDAGYRSLLAKVHGRSVSEASSRRK